LRKILIVLGMLGLFVTGCGGASYDLSVENTPAYVAEGDSEIVLLVMDGEEAVTGATIEGSLEMERMDHGTVIADFQDNGDGTYTAMVDLAMGGEWIMMTEVAHDGDTYQETITFHVSEG